MDPAHIPLSSNKESAHHLWMGLPLEVQRHNILPFLGLKSLVHLDSAICESAARRCFLICLSGHHMIDTLPYRGRFSMLGWLKIRNIKLDSFFLRDDMTVAQIQHLRPLWGALQTLRLTSTVEGDNLREFAALLAPMTLRSFSVQSKRTILWEEVSGGDLLAILSILPNQGNIRSVQVDGVSLVTDLLLQSLAAHCPLLEELRIQDCGSVLYSDTAVAELLSCCKFLRKIHLSGGSVRNSTLGLVGSNCPLLTHLGLSQCSSITDAALLSVLQHCSQLQSLSLDSCHNLTAAGIAACGQHCVCLTHLHLEMSLPNERDVVPFFAHARALTTFDGRLKSETVRRAAPLWHALHSLILRDSDIVDLDVYAIARHCTQLEHLCFNHLRQLTDVSLYFLSLGAPALKNLRFLLCDLISDDGVVALAENGKKLRKFTLGGNERVTEKSVEAVARLKCEYSFFGCVNIRNRRFATG